MMEMIAMTISWKEVSNNPHRFKPAPFDSGSVEEGRLLVLMVLDVVLGSGVVFGVGSGVRIGIVSCVKAFINN